MHAKNLMSFLKSYSKSWKLYANCKSGKGGLSAQASSIPVMPTSTSEEAELFCRSLLDCENGLKSNDPEAGTKLFTAAARFAAIKAVEASVEDPRSLKDSVAKSLHSLKPFVDERVVSESYLPTAVASINEQELKRYGCALISSLLKEDVEDPEAFVSRFEDALQMAATQEGLTMKAPTGPDSSCRCSRWSTTKIIVFPKRSRNW